MARHDVASPFLAAAEPTAFAIALPLVPETVPRLGPHQI